MSLSQDPIFPVLQKYVVCGYHDITGEPWAGMSGRHDRNGQAVPTTNGAGPHNIQMFLLSPDGVVLTCLPGYWAPQDLLTEVRFAAQLDQVWKNNSLSRSQKEQVFKQMHMAHAQEHPRGMVARSHLQGFDALYEAEKPNSDFIKDPKYMAANASGSWGSTGETAKHPPMSAFKTTDVVMHERMAKRPFEAFSHFDVAQYSDYGKWKYDKEEDARMADGSVDHEKLKMIGTIGDPESEKAHKHNANQAQTSSGWGNRGWGSQSQ